MSNYEAGKLYEAVIEEVITDSRQDFEDSGIDESTLQELKRLWCEKLSQTGVCSFAWDDEDNEMNHHIQQSMIPNSNVKPELLHIGSGLELPNIANYPTSASIHGTDLGSTDGTGYSMGIELPSIKQEYSEESGLIIPKINQSDGLIEFTVQCDTDKATKMMQAYKSRKRVMQADGATLDGDDDDDIFNDSDDINSDLDDDLDSEKSDEEDAEQEGQIMLCLYDKVQRVKNKWKCNLKEGVANIDGRDYIFQRATGESEW